MAEQSKTNKLSQGEINSLWNDYKSSLQEMRTFKPAPGVKMVQFDEYGFPKGIGNYHHMFEVGNLDNIPPHQYSDPQEGLPFGAKFIPAPEDSRIHLANIDVDKAYQKMNEEEKEVFECLDHESEISQYEDLGDDFVIAANQEKPAIVEMRPEEIKKEEEQKAIIKPRVAGLLTQEEIELLNERERKEEKEFKEVLKEYDQESSGEEDDESEEEEDSETQYFLDKAPRHTFDDANFNAMIDEFLYRKEVPKKMLNQILPSKAQIDNLVDDKELETTKQEIKEKVLALVKRHEEEDKDIFNSDGQLIISDEEDQGNENQRWDVESYQSRVTNTENHPQVLEKRKLDHQFLNMLLKKKIPKKLLQSLIKFKKAKKPFLKKRVEPMVEKEIEEDVEEKEDEDEEKSAKQMKKEAKKKAKQEKKERREQKKQSKLAFKEEKKKVVEFNTNPNTFAHGLSVKRIK